MTQLTAVKYFYDLDTERQQQLYLNLSNEYIAMLTELMLTTVFDGVESSGDESVLVALSGSENLEDFLAQLSVIVAGQSEYIEQMIHSVVELYAHQCNALGIQLNPLIMNQIAV
jgi:hypothetical protein